MIGRELAHYRILSVLGEGGMGVVYEAEDARLKRRVALKVFAGQLDSEPEHLHRFQREAESLAALNHPNIVTVYSVEEADATPFITMELIEGQTLDQLIPGSGLELERFFDLALPLTDALSTAHELGIVHRDLKPGNIMITEDGRVKVLDFGLAKLQQVFAADASDTTEAKTRAIDPDLTAQGGIVGTVPYMSPEQVEGKPVDSRSDLFSLGAVMYQMVTGQRPFQGDSAAALMSSILKDSPPAVTTIRAQLPRQLGRVIASCLEKNPENRPQTAKGVRNALRSLQRELQQDSILESSGMSQLVPPTRKGHRVAWLVGGLAVALIAVAGLVAWRALGPGPSSPTSGAVTAGAVQDQRQMIAVLPFENLGAPEDEYFADGLTEEITSRLAMLKGLGVISRTSAMQYKQRRASLREIGEELGVDFILEGTVRWDRSHDGPSRVRVTPQLIRVADDTHLWASRYDKQLEEVFAVQSDIAEAVARALNLTLIEPERAALAARPTENMEAYQAYLRAMELWGQSGYDAERNRLAIELLKKATALDPDFVLAWTELASVYDMLYRGGDETEAVLQLAQEAIDRAAALAPDHPEVLIARGYHYYLGYFDYDRALVEFAAAEKILADDPRVHEGIGYILRRQGRFRESLDRLERALRLDPQNAHLHLQVGGLYQALLEHEQAEQHFDRAIALAPDSVEPYTEKAANIVSWRGDIAAAREVMQSAPQFRNPEISFALAYLDRLQGDHESEAARLAVLAPTDIHSPWSALRYYLESGINSMVTGQADRAQQSFLRGRELAAEARDAMPRQPFPYGFLAIFEARLGNRDAALAAVASCRDLSGIDKYYGGQTEYHIAAVYLALGDHQAAIDQLKIALATPCFMRMTVNDLRLDPSWDPLRDDPEFARLLDTTFDS